MAKKKNTENQKPEPTSFNDILKSADGKFVNGIILGLKEDNTLEVHTNIPQFAFIHWLLNRAVFDLVNTENSITAEKLNNNAN